MEAQTKNLDTRVDQAWCIRCKSYLPKENFWKCWRTKNRLQQRCIPCHKAALANRKRR